MTSTFLLCENRNHKNHGVVEMGVIFCAVGPEIVVLHLYILCPIVECSTMGHMNHLLCCGNSSHK